MDELKTLFEKLAKAKFTGELRLRWESGRVAGAELIHFLPAAELGRELPTVENEKEFTLKP